MLVDTHAHLASPVFAEGEEIESLVRRAGEAGVSRIVSIGSDLEDSRRNRELSARFPEVFATVGVHPTSVHEVTDSDWLDQLRTLATQPRVVAIGEIGMDFYHPPQDGSSEADWHARQESFFRAQLDLALELSLPVVIHQRNSVEAIRRILADYPDGPPAVFHCFNGGPELARELLDQGYYLSFTGIVTFPKAVEVHDSARVVPANRLMVETDSPYLAPVPFRGKRCEPAFTRHTAEHLAQLRGVSLEQIASETTATAEAFFGLPIHSPE